MAKSIRYKTDGSGRDSYCVTGDGGFTSQARVVALDPRVAFQRSLRGYDQDGDYLARRARRMQYRRNVRNYSNVLNSDVYGEVNASLKSPLSVRKEAKLDEASPERSALLASPINSLEAPSAHKLQLAGSDGFVRVGPFDERRNNQRTVQERLQPLNQTIVSAFEEGRFKNSQKSAQRFGALVGQEVQPRLSSDMQVVKKNLNQQLRQFNMTTDATAQPSVEMAAKLQSGEKASMR